MNPSFTIALLGQAGVGKSFVGNNLVYYLQTQTLPNEKTIQPSIFQENFSPFAEMQKMGSSCITTEISLDFDQKRINILDTVAIGQLEGASRKKSCQMIIGEIKKKYQNVIYIIICNKEKQLEGDNLKDFYDYYEALQEREKLSIFLNQRDYSRNSISEYILNSYLKQQQNYNMLFQNLGELCKIFNFIENQNVKQILIKYDQQISQKYSQAQQNQEITQVYQPCEQIYENIEQSPLPKFLFSYQELPSDFINRLNEQHIYIIKKSNYNSQTEVHLVLFDFSTIKKYCFKNPQKEFLMKLQKFKQNIVLFYNREYQLDHEIESRIKLNQIKLLRDFCLDSFVAWRDKVVQPINLEEVINLINEFKRL